ncbi:helix-loop-helix DNA-binding domain-containing protein [Sodiomyces alkalinus F11]|uniref:Helix-loop-helix DNA-binding domain-containing protein n=1 Tax=Sodiomyces alkalinus (strain CBS 110278 / VKM F-3762 / F11) TaxID=1314773 RepID=A0A3N2PM49_SODAK|nr:helix-loop-helix DNA-binding domain-containing protein [Sodiomyces alkalinus F11]ROT35607.1 helix-loop-helix DNA-binding domain-containing protein [Sodiomyces alkalinus F11]
MDPQRSSQKVSLAGVLNPDDNRDSAYFSSTDASSKHNSTASGVAVSALSPNGSGYHSSPNDKTPSPVTATSALQPLVSPTQSNMSVASMVSPTTPGGSAHRRPDRPTSLESIGGFDSAIVRRESLDSRMNQGFSDMRLSNSPYASHNQSTSSIQNTLNQQRNPRPGLDSVAVHRISNGYQPNAERDPHSKHAKTAPTITGPTTSQIARAAEPTKGQAWAFPDGDEVARIGTGTSYLDSRRSSITESIASSQFTTESRLPAGQRRLEDNTDYNRLQGGSDFPPVHHHTFQHRQIGDLRDEDASSRTGSQPYSRTPELRKSHKLAERKRRTEMKELFDQLRDLMPQERGAKASKWEILTKAISEHQRMADALRVMQTQNATLAQDIESLRRENHALVLQLRTGSQHPPPTGPPPPPPPGTYSSDPYAHRQELPPLRALNSGPPVGPESMTGVQYEAPRGSGYRPSERY